MPNCSDKECKFYRLITTSRCSKFKLRVKLGFLPDQIILRSVFKCLLRN